MAKTFVLNDCSSKKKSKKKTAKTVIFGILIIAEILLFLQFIIPYIDWLNSYLESHPKLYYYLDYGEYYVCEYCQASFVGVFKYLAIFTHLAGHLIGNVCMDSFGLFIVPDYLAHLILLVVLFVVILLVRPKKKKSAPNDRKTNRSRQTITITFSNGTF